MSEGGKYTLTGLALVKAGVSQHYNIPLGGTTVIVNITDRTRGQIKIDLSDGNSLTHSLTHWPTHSLTLTCIQYSQGLCVP
jgi:hypothetical protein